MENSSMRERRCAGFPALLKRLFDVVLAGAASVALMPVIAAVALVSRVTMGTPVLFRQDRPGKYGRPFTLLKFRTMADVRDANGVPLPDDERMIKVGRVIRATSLDELPQLWNVLRGDMSLVGPRPLLMQYLTRYTPEQARRHEVLPGVTGWAQVNGRNALNWDEKFALDVWYVDHWSLWLDAQVMLKTLWGVVTRKGISNGRHATMPEFVGSSERKN